MAAPKKRRTKKHVVPLKVPDREWDRMSALVTLVGATGMVEGARPVSLILISDPGTGKTELLERFRPNGSFSFHSDLTWKQLVGVLRVSVSDGISHLIFTEFQKLFMRRSAVAENCLGLMVQAMEEGVYSTGVGNTRHNFTGERIGLVAAITHGTLEKKKEMLEEIGFISRAFVIPWEPPRNEVLDIMDRITHGDRSDLAPVILNPPLEPYRVVLPVGVGKLIKDFSWDQYGGRALRPLIRFRALAMAAAVLRVRAENPKTVIPNPIRVDKVDWNYVLGFSEYWDNALGGT